MTSPPLQKRRRRELFGWLGVSSVSFALNLGLTVWLHEVVHLPEEMAYAIALCVVLVVNFLLCRHLIFDRAAHGSVWRQALAFVASSVGFRGCEYLAFLGIHLQFGLDYRITVIVVSLTAMVAKFFFYSAFVFKPTSPVKAAPRGSAA